jgi:hypothetical protein
MAKPRRKLPQSQARPSGRELWEQQQALIRRLAESPAFRDLQEQTRRLRDSPFGRASIEQARRLREAQERILREPAPQPKRRNGGGGRKPLLDIGTVKAMRRTFADALQSTPKLAKHEAAVAELRPKLPKRYRDISDRTIVRQIVQPVLNARTK